MPNSNKQQEFCDFVVDRAQVIGPVTSRPMFGGYGLFLDGLMFGLLADNELYLKVDAQSKPVFVNAGLPPFEYSKNGKTMAMSYHLAPDECLEEVEAMIEWGNRGVAAALRAAAQQTPARKTPK
jgi:DNA transformation protein